MKESEIDIEAAGENLTIKGSKDQDASEGLVHQGLAARNFNKTFVLSDDMVIKGAALVTECFILELKELFQKIKNQEK